MINSKLIPDPVSPFFLSINLHNMAEKGILSRSQLDFLVLCTLNRDGEHE